MRDLHTLYYLMYLDRLADDAKDKNTDAAMEELVEEMEP